MRKLALLVAAVGMVGALSPAGAETSNWAAYAVASTQYSVFGAANAAGPAINTAFCLAGGGTGECAPSPEDIVEAAQSGADGVAHGQWAAMQATGAPDTYPACGDKGTAWAPFPNGHEPETAGLDAVAEPEALALVYDPPVENATRVDIYETNIGGFVTQVDVLLADGPPVVVFSGTDSTGCPGILSVPFTASAPVVGVVVHTAKVGWEEIDAVAVVN